MNRSGALRFCIEFALATGASALAYRIGYGMLLADNDWGMVGLAGVVGLFILLGLIYGLTYGLAALILVAGLVTRRPGIMLGPLAFVLGLVTLSAGQVQENKASLVDAAAAARALDQRVFRPHGGYSVIAVDGGDFCRGICRQILAETDYDFATKRLMFDEPWTLYRRIEGDECFAPENHSSYLEFQADGYEGLCAESLRWRPTGNMLFVSANDNSHGAAEKVVGPGFEGFAFTGSAFEAYERRGSVNRLVGRWIAGTLYAPRNPFSVMSSQEYEKIGKPFAPEDFFAALLDIPIDSD